MLPGQPLQANLLLALYDVGIHTEIAGTPNITNAFAFRFVKQLVDERGVSRMNADWAVSVWCVCYGKNILHKRCEVKISTTKADGSPVIINEQQSGIRQYQDLFRFKKGSDGKEFTIVGFDGENMRTLIFPNRYQSCNVTAILEDAFKECDVREAVMTDGIMVIGRNAFNGCIHLKQVIFPETLIEIGDAAFSGCCELNTAMLPRKLERIGAYSFSNTRIKAVEFPDDIYWLGEGAYSHCSSITMIRIPPKATCISDRLFEGAASLRKVVLPESLLTIGAHAFSGCLSLTLLNIPDSVTSIAENSFQNVNEKFVLQCEISSIAEKYARKHRLSFQLN